MKRYGSARQGVMEKVIEHGADCVVVRTDSHDFTDTSTLDVVDIPADHRSRAISQNHLSQISVRSHLAHKIEKPLAGKRPNVGSIGERRRRCSRCGSAGQRYWVAAHLEADIPCESMCGWLGRACITICFLIFR